MYVKSVLSSAAALLAGVAALTACQSGHSADDAAPAGPSSSVSAFSSAPVSSSTPTRSTKPVASSSVHTSTPTHAAGSGGAKGSGGSSGGTHSGGGDATSDSYAWKHPCTGQQLSVHVTRLASAPTQRVISVRNLGTRSCGLSYYPLVVLYNGEAANGGVTVHPLVPSGLGGPPSFPVYAGRTSYAVIDLDPSGATTGTAEGVDEMNVLANGDHMPNADTLNFSLGAGAHVLKPKLGLYRDNIADAVGSMHSADILP